MTTQTIRIRPPGSTPRVRAIPPNRPFDAVRQPAPVRGAPRRASAGAAPPARGTAQGLPRHGARAPRAAVPSIPPTLAPQAAAAAR